MRNINGTDRKLLEAIQEDPDLLTELLLVLLKRLKEQGRFEQLRSLLNEK